MIRSTPTLAALALSVLVARDAGSTCFDYGQILPEVGAVDLAADPLGVVVSDGFAYVAVSDASLQVVDVSNPAAPSVIATLGGLGTARDVALTGTLLLVGSSTGLHAIDVATPAQPALLGSAPGDLQSIAVHGKTVAAAAGSGGLRIYDITTPSPPAFVTALSLVGGSTLEVLAHSDYFYVVTGSNLHVVNAIGSPAVLGGTFAFGTGLAAEGDRLLIRGFVYSLANPTSPAILGGYPTPISTGAEGIVFSNSTVYVAGSYAPLQVVRIDPVNLANSRFVGLADYGDPSVYDLEVAGGFAYVGAEESLRIIDVGTPLVPSPLAVLDTAGHASDVAVQGRYAYVADSAAGMQIVDLADPWAPVIAGSLATSVSATRVAVAGGIACLKAGNDLLVTDVSDPQNPFLVATLSPAGPPFDVAMRPGFAYVTLSIGIGNSPLQVIDLSNPAAPAMAGSVQVDGGSITLSGTTACVITNGVQLVDVSDPSAPAVRGATPYLGSTVLGIAVDGVRLFANEIHGRFFAFDISNPAAPLLLPSLPGGTSYFRYTGVAMAASRSTVYLSSTYYGLRRVDVGNSTAPPVVRGGMVLVDTPVADAMCMTEDGVLVAAVGVAGLLVLPGQCLGVTDAGLTRRGALLHPAWPNPARDGTTLAFEQPRGEAFTLRAYDVAGRLVRTFRAGRQTAGTHAVHWDGDDDAGRRLANGVYVVRLETPAGAASRRVTLLR